MLERNQLEGLIRHKNAENPVVSLYLNVTPPRKFSSDLNSLIHTTRNNLKESGSYSRETLERLDGVFREIERHVREDLVRTEGARLAAIFADADGFWQEYQLPVGLPSSIVVEPDPYVRPLTVLLDEFARYCVLVADSRKARIFTLYLGEFEEETDVFIEDEVPDRVRAKLSMTSGGEGVQGGLGDERVQRHIQDHVHRHLKYVAQQTFNVFRDKRFSRLILGGHQDKVLPWLKDHLHSYLRQRLAGEFHAGPEESESRLKEQALDVARQYERSEERVLLDRLLEEQGSGGKAVLGVEPTLEALMLGQVHTLVLDHDFSAEGTMCPSDRHLSTYLETCPLCGGPMNRIPDLADEMVEEAIAQRSEVEHSFYEHEGFKPYGIGAFLRFLI